MDALLILFFTMDGSIRCKHVFLCLFSPPMRAYSILFFCLAFASFNKAVAQIASNLFFVDPISNEAESLNSRFIFEHQQLAPFVSFLDSNSVKPDSQVTHLSMGLYGDLAGGIQGGMLTRGIGNGLIGANLRLQGDKRFELEVGYSYLGSALPNQVRGVSEAYEVLWGVGKAKQKGDFLLAHCFYGQATMRLGKYFSLDAGRQKQHIGDGYRSLIISQQSAPLPYLRLNAQVHKVRFFAEWMRATHVYTKDLQLPNRHKYLALHGLSLNLGKRFNWSLYEMVVWQDRDTLNNRGLELHYLNPIAFYRPLEFAQGSADNVILATSMRYKLSPKVALYTQIVLDEFNLGQLKREFKWWANKYGGQFGVKFFNVLKGFDFMVEGNVVRPFTYTHGSPVQSWSNWSQPLAHPLGANFAEIVWRGRLTWRRWRADGNVVYASYGRDKDEDGDGFMDNLGGDIARSYKNPYQQYGNKLLQGQKSNVIYQSLELSFALDKAQSWEIYLSQHYRVEANQAARQEQFGIMIGFRAVGVMSALRDI
jgi:hypothetical protein